MVPTEVLVPVLLAIAEGEAETVAAVGRHLQDHLEVYVQHACTQPVSIQPWLAWWRRPLVGAMWLARRGPGASNHFEGGGFVRSNDDVGYPNLMFHFLPIAIRYDGSSPAGGHGYQVHIGPMYSDARGDLRITSPDPTVKPAIRFNYLSTEQDRREWVEAIRVTRRILGQEALAPFDGGEISPGPEVDTDEQILDWVARDAETALHPSCTCRMGTADDDSVADSAGAGTSGVPPSPRVTTRSCTCAGRRSAYSAMTPRHCLATTPPPPAAPTGPRRRRRGPRARPPSRRARTRAPGG